jgi:DNA-binding Lrp family transcriptional regulator
MPLSGMKSWPACSGLGLVALAVANCPPRWVVCLLLYDLVVLSPSQERNVAQKGQTGVELDGIDQQIVALLRANARRSFQDIGSRVSLSAPAVKRRVDRLRSAGVIRGFTALVDPAAIGWTTEAFVELFCTGRTTPAQIAAATRRHSEVVGAYTVSGEADALVHLRAADIPHLEQALERLRSEPFVTSTRSMIVLSRLVDGAPPRPGDLGGAVGAQRGN